MRKKKKTPVSPLLLYIGTPHLVLPGASGALGRIFGVKTMAAFAICPSAPLPLHKSDDDKDKESPPTGTTPTAAVPLPLHLSAEERKTPPLEKKTVNPAVFEPLQTKSTTTMAMTTTAAAAAKEKILPATQQGEKRSVEQMPREESLQLAEGKSGDGVGGHNAEAVLPPVDDIAVRSSADKGGGNSAGSKSKFDSCNCDSDEGDDGRGSVEGCRLRESDGGGRRPSPVVGVVVGGGKQRQDGRTREEGRSLAVDLDVDSFVDFLRRKAYEAAAASAAATAIKGHGHR